MIKTNNGRTFMRKISGLKDIRTLTDLNVPEESVMNKLPDVKGMQSIEAMYGKNVFSLKTMRNYLSEKAYKSISTTIKEGGKLDPSIADEVADAMKARS